jgi:hypothetical protein
MLLQGGWLADGVFQPGWATYTSYFNAAAKRLSGCDKPGKKSNPVIIGPGWDNVRGTETCGDTVPGLLRWQDETHPPPAAPCYGSSDFSTAQSVKPMLHH